MHRRISILIFFISLILFAETSIVNSESRGSIKPIVAVPDDTEDIQQAIDSLPDAGGTVFIRAGTYIISQGIHIDRSNVTVVGEQGTLIKLGSQVKQPVMLIGTDEEEPSPYDAIQNIQISNLEIDGNKDAQTGDLAEFDPTRCSDPANPETCWIKNNGIDARMVKNLRISNIDIHDARSGGLVVSWRSQKVFISQSSFHHNFFDGIGLYDSEDIFVSDFLCYENGFAGLSIDNRLRQVIFNGGAIKNNGDVGIFVRDSENLNFYNLMVSGNRNHGCYLSHKMKKTDDGEEIVPNTGVKRLLFNGCTFLDNNGYGLHLASTTSTSPNNTIISCVFSGNALGCIHVDSDGSIEQTANICQE